MKFSLKKCILACSLAVAAFGLFGVWSHTVFNPNGGTSHAMAIDTTPDPKG